MTEYEVKQKITYLKGNIMEMESSIKTAEDNIHQLMLLKEECIEDQNSFESIRMDRKKRLQDFGQITGQERLVDAFQTKLGDLFDGTDYQRAYESMNEMKGIIDQEIVKQKQMICTYNQNIETANSSIAYWKRQQIS